MKTRVQLATAYLRFSKPADIYEHMPLGLLFSKYELCTNRGHSLDTLTAAYWLLQYIYETALCQQRAEG